MVMVMGETWGLRCTGAGVVKCALCVRVVFVLVDVACVGEVVKLLWTDGVSLGHKTFGGVCVGKKMCWVWYTN